MSHVKRCSTLRKVTNILINMLKNYDDCKIPLLNIQLLTIESLNMM